MGELILHKINYLEIIYQPNEICFFFKLITGSKSKVLIGYISNCRYYINQCNDKQCLSTLTISQSMIIRSNRSFSHLVNRSRKFCTNDTSKHHNVFGSISGIKSERIEMDADEKTEETLAKDVKTYEGKYRRRSCYIYNNLIISYLNKKDLQSALSVLDSMKKDGVKPILYTYKLLMSGMAHHGHIDQSRKLFRGITDYGLKPDVGIYTSLIQACANCDNSVYAIDRLKHLRIYFHRKGMQLDFSQYCAFIKAYGRHQDIVTAFKVADEAQEIYGVSNIIVSFLLQTIINYKYGLKYALILWHKMKEYKLRPNIFNYNLLLRAIRDTTFGDLKVNDVLISNLNNTRIRYTDVGITDLLNSPPVVSSRLPMVCDKFNNVESVNLDNILESDRLFLFGGYTKIFERMKNDNVTPDIKTLTLILYLLAPNSSIENQYLKYLEQNDMKLDITFFNVLIRNRSLRGYYKSAQSVLNDIQRYHLTPNIVTFGVLAIGCTRMEYAKELLEQMDNIHYRANETILETLVKNACNSEDLSYILYIMRYIEESNIIPSKTMLRNFNYHAIKMSKQRRDERDIREKYDEFCRSYKRLNRSFHERVMSENS